MITVALGGRIAEEIFFDRITTGASDDIKKCTYLRVFICFSGSCFSNSIISTQKEVVSDVSAESALE